MNFRLQQGLTMETILSVAFGVEAKSQTDPNDRITEKAKLIVRWPWWLDIVALIPFSGKFMKYIPWAIKSRFKPIEDIGRAILEKRKKEKVERKVSVTVCNVYNLLMETLRAGSHDPIFASNYSLALGQALGKQ